MTDAESKVKAKLEWLREQVPLYDTIENVRVFWKPFEALLDIAEKCLAHVEHTERENEWSLYAIDARTALDALGDLPNE